MDKMTKTKEIYLAGGCFWGTEHYFKQIEGVVNTEVGFANGHTENPTYQEVYTDTTGFVETVHIQYNPEVVGLAFLLQMFFKAIDPTSLNKQGHDEGTRYRTGIYYTNPEDLPIIEKVYQEEQKHYQHLDVVAYFHQLEYPVPEAVHAVAEEAEIAEQQVCRQYEQTRHQHSAVKYIAFL